MTQPPHTKTTEQRCSNCGAARESVEEIKAAVEVAVQNGYDVQVTLKKEGRSFYIRSKRREVEVK